MVVALQTLVGGPVLLHKALEDVIARVVFGQAVASREDIALRDMGGVRVGNVGRHRLACFLLGCGVHSYFFERLRCERFVRR